MTDSVFPAGLDTFPPLDPLGQRNTTNKIVTRLDKLGSAVVAIEEAFTGTVVPNPVDPPPPPLAFSPYRRVSVLDAFGHSYTTTGASASAYLWWNDLARQIGATPTNWGISGSVMSKGNGVAQGGYAAVLQSILPTGARTLAVQSYSPNLGIAACAWGLNDVADAVTNNGADISQLIVGWKHSLRAILSRLQCSMLNDSPDLTYVAYGGAGWGEFGSVNQNSGAGYHQTSTAGTTVTVTVPSGWVGGTLVLGFVTNRIGGATPGSVVTFTVDGVTTAPLGITDPFNTDQVNLATIATQGSAVARFALAAGAHTVVATAGTGGMAFDYLAVESLNPRPVLFAGIARTPNSSATVKSCALQVNDATKTVLAEFNSPAMQYVDIDAQIGGTSPTWTYYADGTHPNDVGHARIADAMAEILRTMTLTTRSFL